MAAHLLGSKSFSSMIRQRVKPSARSLATDFVSPSSAGRPHSHLSVGSLASSVPASFKSICGLPYHYHLQLCSKQSGKLSLRAGCRGLSSSGSGALTELRHSGNLPLRAGHSCLSSSGSVGVAEIRVFGQELTRAHQRISAAPAGSICLKLSAGALKKEEQQETRAGVGKMVAVRDTVELTPMEEKIFGILTATLNHFSLKTQLRVAGGWVRDKLIGRNSCDIDIALDDMLGRIFCEKVNEYLKMIGENTHSFGVILSNPVQSKHLETATMRVLGVSIDFVNLRAETYTDTSRIPEMEFGTPEQDAYRRDLTINSLFYNINTKMVEDFTKQGIADLKLGIIRTPLAPDTTFFDDPLRVLRAIRFGARYGFTLSEDLKTAAATEAVRTALENKVSRERVGHEVELMMMGNQPEKAMKNIEDLSLFSAVFRVSQELEPDPPILENYGRLCVNALQAVTQIFAKIRFASNITEEQRRLLVFGALFLPLHPSTCFLDKRKKKKIALSRYVISESLKLKNNDASGVEALHAAALRFQPLIKQLLQPELYSPEDVTDSLGHEDSKAASVEKYRVELGLLLIHCKDLWQCGLLLASVLDLPSLKSQKGADIMSLSSDNQAWIEQKVEICNAVEEIVIKLGLTNVWEIKPLLDGHQIMSALNLGKGGKQVQEWKNRVLRWHLAHPQSTSEECLDWIAEENVKRATVAFDDNTRFYSRLAGEGKRRLTPVSHEASLYANARCRSDQGQEFEREVTMVYLGFGHMVTQARVLAKR